MTMTQSVSPGQLITSALMNEILTRLANVEAKLASVSGTPTATPTITSITGLTTPIRTGDPVNINGANFTSPQGNTTVSFNGINVPTFLSPATPSLLQVRVPALTVPSTGAPVTVYVGNGAAIGSATVTIFPVQVPVQNDQISVEWTSVSPTTITAGQATPVLIAYKLKSFAGQDEAFTINASVTTAGWPANLSILDSTQKQTTNNQISVTAGGSSTFYVSIPSVPSGATTFTLNVTAGVGAALNGQQSTFPVGVAILPPDTSITLAYGLFTTTDSHGNPPTGGAVFGSWNPSSASLQIKSGDFAHLAFTVQFTNQSQLIYSYGVTSPGTPAWQSSPTLNATLSTLTLHATDFVGTPPTATRSLTVDVAPNSGTSAAATLNFSIGGQGATTNQTLPINVSVMT
jgi:hypothetical protein